MSNENSRLTEHQKAILERSPVLRAFLNNTSPYGSKEWAEELLTPSKTLFTEIEERYGDDISKYVVPTWALTGDTMGMFHENMGDVPLRIAETLFAIGYEAKSPLELSMFVDDILHVLHSEGALNPDLMASEQGPTAIKGLISGMLAAGSFYRHHNFSSGSPA